MVISLARKRTLDENSHDVPAGTGGDSSDGTAALEAVLLPDKDWALLRRYARLGAIAPRDETEIRGVSRTTAYRRLLSLEQGGWIVRHGATTAKIPIIAFLCVGKIDPLQYRDGPVRALDQFFRPEPLPADTIYFVNLRPCLSDDNRQLAVAGVFKIMGGQFLLLSAGGAFDYRLLLFKAVERTRTLTPSNSTGLEFRPA